MSDTASSSNITDDQLSQFFAFTGSSDPNAARQYLEMSGNNLEMAVSLFLEHGANGGGVGGGGAGIGGASSGGGIGGGGGASGIGAGGDHQVRAPDQTRTMRLMDFDSPNGGGRGGGGMPSAALMAAVGGPSGRQMMAGLMAGGIHGVHGAGGMNMGGMAGGIHHDDDDMMGGMDMGNTWASLDAASSGVRRAVNQEAARRTSRSQRNNSGSGSGRNRRRRSDMEDANNNANADDDDDVQVVDQDGQQMDQDNDNDNDNDNDDYHYDDSSDDDYPNDIQTSHPTRSNNNNNTSTAPIPPSLSTMFAPPTHLMHRGGGFMGAKNMAKDARRWLLVNIQSQDDFACHALNRDVWREELVENLVREGFIFWQAMSHTPEGQTYVTRYKVHGYPHLAIIDPRTGSLLWRKEGWTQVNPLTAEQFVEIASDFCSRHSFDKMPVAARHGYSNGGGASGGSGIGAASGGMNERPAKRPIHELSEEEQLQAAIRASMQTDGGEDDGDGGDDAAADGEVEVVEMGDQHPQTTIQKDARAASAGDGTTATATASNTTIATDDEEQDCKPASTSAENTFENELLTMEVGDEPTSGTALARVQIKMPDGKRLVRKFQGEDTVKTIYAFVAQSNEEAKGGRPFELKAKFPPQDLFSSVDDSISSCGLSGEAINVIWK